MVTHVWIDISLSSCDIELSIAQAIQVLGPLKLTQQLTLHVRQGYDHAELTYVDYEFTTPVLPGDDVLLGRTAYDLVRLLSQIRQPA